MSTTVEYILGMDASERQTAPVRKRAAARVFFLPRLSMTKKMMRLLGRSANRPYRVLSTMSPLSSATAKESA